MAEKNGCADVSALAVCHRVWRGAEFGPRRPSLQESGLGISICPAARYRRLGYYGRTQARQKPMLRLRQFCVLLALHRAHLLVSDPRRAGFPHVALFRGDLARCNDSRFRDIDYSRACSMTLAPPNYRAALDAGREICLHIWRHWPGASERRR
jgi:hypothetical protein